MEYVLFLRRGFLDWVVKRDPSVFQDRRYKNISLLLEEIHKRTKYVLQISPENVETTFY